MALSFPRKFFCSYRFFCGQTIKSENYAEEREIGPKLIFIAFNFYGFPASFSPTSEKKFFK